MPSIPKFPKRQTLLQFFLAVVVVGGSAICAVLLRGFLDGARAGDPEGYLLAGAILFGIVSSVALFALVAPRRLGSE